MAFFRSRLDHDNYFIGKSSWYTKVVATCLVIHMIYLWTSLFMADQSILNMEVILMINIILFCSLIEINFFLWKEWIEFSAFLSCFNFHFGRIRTVNMTIIYIFFFQRSVNCHRLVDAKDWQHYFEANNIMKSNLIFVYLLCYYMCYLFIITDF